MTAWVQRRQVAGPGRCQCVRPARTSLGSVIGFLAIENAFESTKVPFRWSQPLIETGAADFVFRLLYYDLRQLLQTLTSPHSINLHLRCALDVVEQVICVGYRLTSPSPRFTSPLLMPTSMNEEALTSDQCMPNGIW